MKMKAVLYARVSSREQKEGFSLEAQVKLIRDYALRNGIEIVEIAPNDLFPVKDLEEKLITLMKQKQVF